MNNGISELKQELERMGITEQEIENMEKAMDMISGLMWAKYDVTVNEMHRNVFSDKKLEKKRMDAVKMAEVEDHKNMLATQAILASIEAIRDACF